MKKNGLSIRDDVFRGINKLIMAEIINEVMKSGKKGISKKILSNKLKSKNLTLNRDTLRRYMNRLMKNNLVVRNGAKGKFYINFIYFSKSDIGGKAFGSLFVKEVLGKDNIAPKSKRMMIGTDYYSEIQMKNKSYGIMFDGLEENIYRDILNQCFRTRTNLMQKSIIEFSNQIGAYHIFIYLLAFEKYHVDNDASKLLKTEGIEWLKYALSEYILKSYYKFQEMMLNYKLDTNQEKIVNQYIKENNLRMSSTIKKALYGEMSFLRIYPYIYTILHTFDKKIKDDNKIMEKELLNVVEKLKKENK